MTITKNSRILIISPHPDDESLGVGGLMSKAVKEKAELLLVYMCVGDSRQLVTKQTQEDTRLNEISDVEKMIQAKCRILYTGHEFTRLDTIPQKDLIEKIEDIVEQFKPDIMAIPSYNSYNQDHRATYEACMTALRPTPRDIRHFTPNVLEYFEPYFWGVTGPRDPNVYLNLDEKIDKKRNLLDYKLDLYRCHATQVRQDPFPRSVENLVRLAHIYGKEAGLVIAEAYHLLRQEIL